MRKHYEDAPEYDADAYTVKGWSGIAWYVRGWETEPNEDTERTGNLVCTMIGDDRHFSFESKDVTPLEREAYCGECGQVGCTHDGLEREA
jgi:hypothetical protein